MLEDRDIKDNKTPPCGLWAAQRGIIRNYTSQQWLEDTLVIFQPLLLSARRRGESARQTYILEYAITSFVCSRQMRSYEKTYGNSVRCSNGFGKIVYSLPRLPIMSDHSGPWAAERYLKAS